MLSSVAHLSERSQLFAADSTASSSWSSRGRKEDSRKKSTRTNDDLPAIVSHNSILEDSVGRVNRDLAERIWNWEQERRDSSQLPRLEYSVRSGLKLVSKLAAELRQLSKFAHRVSDPSDLVQEGLVALLDAIGSYPGSDPAEFERFASRRIQESLARSLQQHDTTSPSPPAGVGAFEVIPRQSLPRSVQRTLQRAQQVAKELTGPRTLSRVASEMDMAPERLRDCIELASSVRRQDQIGSSEASMHRPSRQHRQNAGPTFPKAMLSFESTVEISNPQLQDSVEYRDQDEWELWQGLLLDDGRGSIRRDELVEDFVDETLHDEGDDDSWIRHQQNAGRLQDLIPDTSTETNNDRSRSGSGFGLEPSVDDDMALVELIRGDLSSFLSDTLTEQEQQIVQMAFGLTESREPPTSQSRIAAALGLDKGVVSKALAQAIAKLRVAYRTRYVEPYSDDNDDLIDSV
jgi:RNA polymerase sigma factor (sigma-70 family)